MNNDNPNKAPDGHARDLEKLGNESQEDAERDIRTSEAPFTGEENLGEQDILGGTEPAPEANDDVGTQMKRATGNDPDPDMDNPRELNFAKKVDDDEKKIEQS